MQQAVISPEYFGQGINQQIAMGNYMTGRSQAAYKQTMDANKRATLSNLYNQTQQQENRQPTWEEIETVYAKYGDTDGVERARANAYKQKVNVFESKANLYLKQAEKAYTTGDDNALMTIQKAMNDDPSINEFIGNVTLLPNNQISYVLTDEQDVIMDGGTIKKGNQGDQVVAYKTTDEQGRPVYYATEIKPTGLSTAIKKASIDAAGGSGEAANINAFEDDIERNVTGKGQFSDIVYSNSINMGKDIKTIFTTYQSTKNRIENERFAKKIPQAVLDNKMQYVDKAASRKMNEYFDTWISTKDNKKFVKQAGSADKVVLKFMTDNGIPPSEFTNIFDLLFPAEGA